MLKSAISAACKFAVETGSRISFQTSHDADDIALSKINGNIVLRNQLYIDDGQLMLVTYEDRYPFSPLFLIWLRSFVPMFPNCASIKQIQTITLNADETTSEKIIYDFLVNNDLS